MLVICNGALRSGSTWIYNLALEAIPNRPLSAKWQRPGWNNQALDPERFNEFLAAGLKETYVVKARHHPGTPARRDALLAHPDLIVLNIGRDIRGALNSHYWWRRHNGGEETVEAYFEKEGRRFVEQESRFHQVWDTQAPNYHRFSYEGLLADFSGELERARRVLELAGPVGAASGLQEKTTRTALIDWHSRLQGRDVSSFFRKGEATDWKSVLPEDVAGEAVALAGDYAFTQEAS